MASRRLFIGPAIERCEEFGLHAECQKVRARPDGNRRAIDGGNDAATDQGAARRCSWPFRRGRSCGCNDGTAERVLGAGLGCCRGDQEGIAVAGKGPG